MKPKHHNSCVNEGLDQCSVCSNPTIDHTAIYPVCWFFFYRDILFPEHNYNFRTIIQHYIEINNYKADITRTACFNKALFKSNPELKIKIEKLLALV